MRTINMNFGIDENASFNQLLNKLSELSYKIKI